MHDRNLPPTPPKGDISSASGETPFPRTGDESWFGAPIPASGYDPSVPDCGMTAARVFDAPIPGLEGIGTLAVPNAANLPESANASIGFEGIDRGLFDPDRAYDRLAAAGIKWARVQTMWSRCERQKGVLDFTVLDGVVDNLVRRGIRPWFSVTFGNTLYMDGCLTGAAVGCVPLFYGAECASAWKRYVRALARRYAGRVSHWEIWNEPDIRNFWRPNEPDGGEYLKLVQWTGSLIRAEAPDAKIGGCSAAAKISEWGMNFIRLGGVKEIDFWSFHPYGLFPERLRSPYAPPDGPETDDFVLAAQAEREFMDAHGGRHVEFWNGESGCPSWFHANHWLFPTGVCQEGWQSQANQAKWLLRRFVTDRRAGFARSSFYQTADISRVYSMGIMTRPHPAEHGILNGWTYAPKMSYRAFGHYNALLATATNDATLPVVLSPEADGETPTVAAAFRTADGAPLFLYYAAFDFSGNYLGSCYAARLDATLTVPADAAPAHPVLVDMLRGGVYSVASRTTADGTASFSGLPLTDYPLVLMDADDVPLVPTKDGVSTRT